MPSLLASLGHIQNTPAQRQPTSQKKQPQKSSVTFSERVLGGPQSRPGPQHGHLWAGRVLFAPWLEAQAVRPHGRLCQPFCLLTVSIRSHRVAGHQPGKGATAR